MPSLALFRPPPSERGVTVSASPRSPVVTPVAFQLQVTFSSIWLSAFRVPYGDFASDHLCPFALWTTFSSALVARYFHDYYGHSVPMGLAPGRESLVPSR